MRKIMPLTDSYSAELRPTYGRDETQVEWCAFTGAVSRGAIDRRKTMAAMVDNIEWHPFPAFP
jgi:hypothetical protein